MKREQVLHQAGELINGQRHSDYGTAWENHERIARIWSVVLGVYVKPEQVALCMLGVKIGRLVNDIHKADSWIDIAGYAALGAEMAEAR
jgi:hypothetical protein